MVHRYLQRGNGGQVGLEGWDGEADQSCLRSSTPSQQWRSALQHTARCYPTCQPHGKASRGCGGGGVPELSVRCIMLARPQPLAAVVDGVIADIAVPDLHSQEMGGQQHSRMGAVSAIMETRLPSNAVSAGCPSLPLLPMFSILQPLPCSSCGTNHHPPSSQPTCSWYRKPGVL